MSRNAFEQIKKVIRDQTNKTPGLVTNLHGIIDTTVVEEKRSNEQTWYALTVEARSLPTLREAIDAYSYNKTPYTTLVAREGSTAFPAQGSLAPGQAAILLSSINLPGATVVPITVTAPGYDYAVYSGEQRLVTGRGTGEHSIHLGTGLHYLSVVLFGGVGAVRVDVPATYGLSASEPLPSPPILSGGPLSAYLNAANGSYQVSLSWTNDAFASAWSVYRAQGVEATTIFDAVIANERTATVWMDGLHSIAAGEECYTPTFYAGKVLSTSFDGDTTEVQIEVAPSAPLDFNQWVGQVYIRPSNFEPLGRVSYAGNPILNYVDSAVQPNVLYVYKLTAFGFLTGAVESDFSETGWVTVRDTTAPGPVTFTPASDITVIDGEVVLNYTAPNDPDYRGVKVFRNNAGTLTLVATDQGAATERGQLAFRPTGAGTYVFLTYDWGDNTQTLANGVSWVWDGSSTFTSFEPEGDVELTQNGVGAVSLRALGVSNALSFKYVVNKTGFVTTQAGATTQALTNGLATVATGVTLAAGETAYVTAWFYEKVGATGMQGRATTASLYYAPPAPPRIEHAVPVRTGQTVDYTVRLVEGLGLGGTLSVWMNKVGTASANKDAAADSTYTVASTPATITPAMFPAIGGVTINSAEDKLVYMEFVASNGATTGKVAFKVPGALSVIGTDGNLLAGAVTKTAIAAGLSVPEVVSTLPTTGNTAGRIVFLTTDGKLYRYNAGAWTSAVPAVDITGTIVAAQIADAQIDLAKLATSISAPWRASTNPTTRPGGAALQTGDMYINSTSTKLFRWDGSAWTAAVATSDLTGQITNGQIANEAISTAKFAQTIRPVELSDTLPASGTTQGQIVFNKADNKMYRWTGTAWTSAVPAVDITGTLSQGQIGAGAIDITKFASGITPNEIVSTLPTTGNFAGRVVFLTTDNKLYRHDGTQWTSAVPAADITGTIQANQIANGTIDIAKLATSIRAPEILAALPTTGNTQGRLVFLTTDNKLYRYNGTAFVASVPTGDLTGTIAANQIAANAVTATALAADSVIAGKIAAAAITAREIAVNAITAAQLVVTDWTNLVPNPVFITGDGTDWLMGTAGSVIASGGAEVPVGAGTAHVGKVNVTTGNTNVYAHSSWAQVQEGETFFFSIRVAAGTGCNGNMGIYGMYTHAVTGGGTSTLLQSITPAAASAWTTISGSFTVPVGFNRIRLRLLTPPNATPVGSWYFTNATVRKMAGSTLIENGAITTAKIVAGAITANELAANSVVAGKIAAAAVSATEIAAGAITTEKLQVGSASNRINNPTVTGVADGWTRSTTAGTNSLTVVSTVQKDGVTVRTLRSTSDANNQISTNWFEVDPNVTYEVRISLMQEGGTATATSGYFGMFARTADNVAVNVTRYSHSSRTFSTSDSNPYFWNAGTHSVNTWRDMVAYVIGSNVTDPDAVPPGQNVETSFRMPPNCRFLQLRWLNWANTSGTARIVHAYSPTIFEMDVTRIDGGSILTNTLDATRIKANSITAAQIAAGTITAGQIAANTITANELAANSIIAGKIAAGAVGAAEIAAGAIVAGKLAIVDFSNNVQNPSFEGSKLDGWATTTGTLTVASATSGGPAPFSGRVTAGAAIRELSFMGEINVNAGEAYFYEAWYYTPSNSTGSFSLNVQTNTAGTVQLTTSSTLGAWTKVSGTYTVAAGVGKIKPVARVNVGTGVWEFTQFKVTRQSGATLIQDGAITTDKMTANTINGNVITTNTLHGSKIVADSITAGQIEAGAITVNELASNSVTAIKIVGGTITGDKLLAHTITALQIEARTITATEIAANTITANELAANSIIAGKIAAGAVGADQIVAGAIQTKHLLISSGGAALNRNPDCNDLSAWVVVGSPGYVDNLGASGKVGPYAIRNLNYGSSTGLLESYSIPVDPTKTYRIRGWFLGGGASATFYMMLALYDGAGGNITGDGSYWYYPASNVTATSTWTLYEGLFGAGTSKPFPTNALSMAPGVLLNYNSAQGNVWVQDLRVEEVIGATLIKDGAITTDKVAANAITAGKISVGSLSEIKTNLGIMVAGKLVGNTTGNFLNLNATSAQTDPAHDDYWFIKAQGLKVKANGSAEFSGTLNAPSGTFGTITAGLLQHAADKYIHLAATGSQPFLKFGTLEFRADGTITWPDEVKNPPLFITVNSSAAADPNYDSNGETTFNSSWSVNSMATANHTVTVTYYYGNTVLQTVTGINPTDGSHQITRDGLYSGTARCAFKLVHTSGEIIHTRETTDKAISQIPPLG